MYLNRVCDVVIPLVFHFIYYNRKHTLKAIHNISYIYMYEYKGNYYIIIILLLYYIYIISHKVHIDGLRKYRRNSSTWHRKYVRFRRSNHKNCMHACMSIVTVHVHYRCLFNIFLKKNTELLNK